MIPIVPTISKNCLQTSREYPIQLLKKLLCILCLLFSFLLVACSNNDLIEAKEAFVKKKTEEEKKQLLVSLEKLSKKGEPEAQLMYMITEEKCQVADTDNKQVTFFQLRNSGHPMALFMTAKSFTLSKKRNRCIFFSAEAYNIDSEQDLKWLEESASKRFLPAKVLLVKMHYEGRKPYEGNSVYLKSDVLKARNELADAIKIAQNDTIDIIQHRWSQQVLGNGFDGPAKDRTNDPIVRIQRLKLLTLLNPDWQVKLDRPLSELEKSEDEDEYEERRMTKFYLMDDILKAKYKSIEQVPFDDDAKKSIVIANELLAQVKNLLPKQSESLNKRQQRFLHPYTKAGEKEAREEAKKKRQEFAQIVHRAKQFDGEAMKTAYLTYAKLPTYHDKAEQEIEKMMKLSETIDDNNVVDVIANNFLIKDKKKRIKLLRRCAEIGNAQCMRHLGKELIYDQPSTYPEGIHWVYQAMEKGDTKAENLLKKIPRHKLGNWTRNFIGIHHYQQSIPDSLACHAAQFIESKEQSRQNAWSDMISSPEMLILFKRGAKTGDSDCINRLNEHYRN